MNQPEPDPLDLIEQADAMLATITEGTWGARYFDGDLSDEADRFAVALRLSAESAPDAGQVAWRLIVGDDDENGDGDWLNLAFFGNGPTSRANAVFAASAPNLVRRLVDALREAVQS